MVFYVYLRLSPCKAGGLRIDDIDVLLEYVIAVVVVVMAVVVVVVVIVVVVVVVVVSLKRNCFGGHLEIGLGIIDCRLNVSGNHRILYISKRIIAHRTN